MADLVTLQEAYEHLRIDYDSEGSADDAWLSVFIPAISEAVRLWLKDSWRPYEVELDANGDQVIGDDGRPVVVLDDDGNPVVRWVVKAACLVELSSQYRFREGEGKDNAVPADAGHGYVLNKASTALLAPLRRPTVA